MYNAELDLCETDKHRIQVLEQMLMTARETEEHTVALAKEARGTGIDMLKSKADRPDVEIALHRAKAK